MYVVHFSNQFTLGLISLSHNVRLSRTVIIRGQESCESFHVLRNCSLLICFGRSKSLKEPPSIGSNFEFPQDVTATISLKDEARSISVTESTGTVAFKVAPKTRTSFPPFPLPDIFYLWLCFHRIKHLHAHSSRVQTPNASRQRPLRLPHHPPCNRLQLHRSLSPLLPHLLTRPYHAGPNVASPLAMVPPPRRSSTHRLRPCPRRLRRPMHRRAPLRARRHRNLLVDPVNHHHQPLYLGISP